MLCLYFSFTLLNFVLFRHDCGMFVLKNADCLGQDLDPAKEHYAQKDMANVRRMVLLELIRLKITNGTSAATLPASIDPKGDGVTKVGIETKESDSQPSTIENGTPPSDDDSEPSSKRLKPNGAPSIDAIMNVGTAAATLPASIDPKDAIMNVGTAAESDSESDSDPDDVQPLSKRRNKDANKDEDEGVKPEDEDDDNKDDNEDDNKDDDEADTVWDKENEGKTDGLVWKLEWLDSILKIENIEPITLGDLLSLLYKPTRDAISCMVDICRRDWVLPQNSFFVADGEDITSESIKLFEGNAVSNAVYIGE